ncbi:cytochrome c-type biogenesis protein CcsB [Salana multivorans]|uniref:Cytochrome c-type biogenesis protein CcsB n=1 Tax=Salana multivorans TaxID=120377 RepID=A0A3N2D8I0_9MICO|nr:c-type cytochrome biogenesis protein CcsB [Salana multivorans]OJX97522.1 MAG: c-type cytochrome biogenesis protein CcsB [Micrococcales bacterium 73-15]ROR96091.1 cytochrome c-type biogenesis protein CcsB [Salana multivorans]
MTGQLSLYFVTFALTAYLISAVSFAIDLTRRAPVRPTRARSLVGVGAGGADEAAAGGSLGRDAGIDVVVDAADAGSTSDPVPGAVSRRAAGIGMSTFLAGTALLLAGVVTRGIAAGRVPWANMYEFTLMSVLVASVVFLAIQRRTDVRYLGTFLAGLAVLFLFLALTVLYLDPASVQPALQNYWLVIHVSIATSAVGLSTVGAVTSALQLVKDRYESRGTQPRAAWGRRIVASLPAPESLERLAYRINAVAFVMWTFTLVSGAIWAEHAWGRFWGWDAKEVWTFVTWVIYAAYLHARATRGWEGRRAAWFSVAGFLSIIVNYWIINQFANSLHGYSGLG